MLGETGVDCRVCGDINVFVGELREGAGFAVITEEALIKSDIRPLKDWIDGQPEWSDFPFVLLTQRGGGLERNPAAARHLITLGNVTFLERPFHPTTLVSLAQAALRGRRRQYEARARLEALRASEANLEERVQARTKELELAQEALRQWWGRS
jgi:DNA-binding NtrC family response regulator